jgi:hypothetical protein
LKWYARDRLQTTWHGGWAAPERLKPHGPGSVWRTGRALAREEVYAAGRLCLIDPNSWQELEFTRYARFLLTKKQIMALEKKLKGKVTKQTFPFNLHVPQNARDSHFTTACTTADD